MNKPKIIKDYEKLSDEIIEQIKLVYPRGFRRHLISFVNRDGEKRMGLPFETEDYYYLIRMTKDKAVAIVEGDDDFDQDGILKASVKERFEEKYEDEDFLNELNSNEDNDLGFDDELEDELADDMDDD